MLAAEKADLVSLLLPNLEHFEATMQVLEAGYPLRRKSIRNAMA
jgi:predicted dehydrogenase